jgi:formylglycine-generating enzyme required for sulfatase activity
VEPLALPVHGVRLSAFCLDVAEVTVDAYHGCPTATCTSPGIQPTCNWNVAGRGGHPVNCVTFAQAQTYCASRSGATLPTEAQWEYAARGVDGRPYPWGDAAPASQLCWSGGGTVQPNTCAGRAFPASGPFGLFDMAGGVSEMTLDWYGPYFGNASSFEMDPPGPASGPGRIIRGGSWRSTSANDVRVYSRELMDAAYATAVGFRCARAAP